MPKRSSKPKDVNSLAHAIMGEATAPKASRASGAKNPAAVELGRLGGLKGGRARAAKLSSARRTSIAKKAALARWGRKKAH